MSESTNSANIVQSLASYLPPAVARKIHTGPLTQIQPHVERFPAAVLFADVEGFTGLNEKLLLADPNGVEGLTSLLNSYFSRLISLLEAEGGEVVQFSGDALTAVFDGRNVLPPTVSASASIIDPGFLQKTVRSAWQAAKKIQEAMADFSGPELSPGKLTLGIRLAIGAGEISAFTVGGVLGHWHYVIAGDPMSQVARAAAATNEEQIILSQEARALFSKKNIQTRPLRPLQWTGVASETVKSLYRHVPDVVGSRLETGQAGLIAELRRITSIFLGVRGINYTQTGSLHQLQRFVESIQKAVYHYEGSLNKLLVDDKGTVGIFLFGAPPNSHEDDPARAVRFALELQEIATSQQLQLSCGITTGQVFAGPVGSESRREYTVIGDSVNLAARLMQQSGLRGISCDFNTYQATREQIDWHPLPPRMVKGKAAAVRIYQPLGLRNGQRKETKMQPMIGRKEEMARIQEAFNQFLDGQLRVICLEGEAGTGKSRFASEILQRTRDEGLVALMGSGDDLEKQNPYNAWRDVFRSFFDLDKVTNPADQRMLVTERLEDVAPNLQGRISLLNDLLGLDIPETNLTTSFSPKLRQASLSSFLVELLEQWASERPLVIILEDAQWLDSLSWRLVLQLARSLPTRPILLALALRPLKKSKPDHLYNLLTTLPQTERILLGELNPEDVVQLAAIEMGVEELPQEIQRFIAKRSAGNPLVIQEIARSLLESSTINILNSQCMLIGPLNELQVPESLHGLVLSRIDRLPAGEQLTLKVASVIGRVFGYATLRQILGSRLTEAQLDEALESLIEHNIIHPIDAPTSLRSHSFNQVIFQEVTYSTLLQSQRKEVHEQTARWYEKSDTSPDLYPLLAYHWRQADEPKRELGYSILAGYKLAAEFANNEALSFLSRALQLAGDNETKYELLTLLLDIHERLGDRAAQEEDLKQLQTLVEQPKSNKHLAEVANAWANYYRNISDYSSAMVALRSARTAVINANDLAGEAKNLTILGQVLEHQGAYKDAKVYFKKALALYRRLGDHQGEADNLSHISNVCRYLGDNKKAKNHALKALELRRVSRDRGKEAVSLYNLGLIAMELGETDEATNYHQQSFEISQSIGDRVSEALSLSAIGYGCMIQGDLAAAQKYLQQALRLHQMMNEKLREADCLNALGAVWRDVGNDRNAQKSFEQALAIQERIGSNSFIAYTYLNLGFVNLQFNSGASQECYQKALHRARATGNRDAEAFALSYLGGLHEFNRKWQPAAACYENAITIHRELKAPAAVIENMAGLARVYLAENKMVEARQLVESCMTYLEGKGSEGMEFPLQVYLTCYDLMKSDGRDLVSQKLLEAAYSLLMERADAISEQVMREGMLHNVSINNRVLTEWQDRFL